MPLMNTPFRPGHCMEAIEGMKAGPTRDIALAEYHYFSGQAEKALEETQVYLTAKDAGGAAFRLLDLCLFLPDHGPHRPRPPGAA